MRRSKLLAAVACLVFAASCACGTSETTGGQEDARLIRELDAAWSRALQVKDLDTVMSNYADDAVFLAPNQPIVEGKEKIREWFAIRIARPGYSASFAPTKIVVSESRDVAYELGTFRAMANNDKGEPIIRTGKHLVAWEKRAGHWKVTAESINNDSPPDAPAR